MSYRTEKVWALSNTGTKVHAFKAEEGGYVALCRSTIKRSGLANFRAYDEKYSPAAPCTRCEKLFLAACDREEASMEPVQERHDVEYVAPVDERNEAPAAGTRVATPYGTGVVQTERGVVSHDHPNHGKTWVSVMLDKGLTRRHRVFVDDLTDLDDLHRQAIVTNVSESLKAARAVEPYPGCHAEDPTGHLSETVRSAGLADYPALRRLLKL